jgi:hypothetical protein
MVPKLITVSPLGNEPFMVRPYIEVDVELPENAEPEARTTVSAASSSQPFATARVRKLASVKLPDKTISTPPEYKIPNGNPAIITKPPKH